jgi:two-component system chemotaxis response regulator CheB
MLPQILQRQTDLYVVEARDEMPIERGTVYVAPPNRHLLLSEQNVQVLQGPKHNRHRPAIDPLFRSAAHVFGPRVVGVILTGFMSDGSVGLAAIKAAGGVAIVQDPSDAQVPSMPRAALQRVEADHCVPLAKIPAVLGSLFQQEGGERLPAMSKPHGVPPPTSFTCPDCHGTIWEVEEAGEVRYECRVGHIFSAGSFGESHDEAMERALWAAVRSLEESSAVAHRLARLAQERNRPSATTMYERRAHERKSHAELLRDLLVGKAPKSVELEGTRGEQDLEEVS